MTYTSQPVPYFKLFAFDNFMLICYNFVIATSNLTNGGFFMEELRSKLEERIIKNKNLLQAQLKNLLANGKDEDNHIVLGDDISKEEVSSFLEALSSANTIEEISKFFSSSYQFRSVWYFSLFITIDHDNDLLMDTVYHLDDFASWESQKTDAEKEKKRVEKEIADLEKQRTKLEQEAKNLQEKIEKALQQ